VSKELIINVHAAGAVDIALLIDKKLIELHHEKSENNYAVGDIYLGTVSKLMPGLNAAFIDVGHERDAFLHYLDLGPQVKSLHKFTKQILTDKNFTPWPRIKDKESDIVKSGKVMDVLTRNQRVIVQVAKEPISNKGPRLTSELSLAGRFVVLIPFSEGISLSKKIVKNEERTRLKKLVNDIKPKNFGVIVRTVAENKSISEIENDLKELLRKWESLVNQLRTATPPFRLHGEGERLFTLVRDILNSDFTAIHINEQNLYQEIKSYISNKAPRTRKNS